MVSVYTGVRQYGRTRTGIRVGWSRNIPLVPVRAIAVGASHV